MTGYFRELSVIEEDFKVIDQELIEPDRTIKLVNLMNELEANYSTFKFNPTQEELQKPAMILYKAISAARMFD